MLQDAYKLLMLPVRALSNSFFMNSMACIQHIRTYILIYKLINIISCQSNQCSFIRHVDKITEQLHLRKFIMQ